MTRALKDVLARAAATRSQSLTGSHKPAAKSPLVKMLRDAFVDIKAAKVSVVGAGLNRMGSFAAGTRYVAGRLRSITAPDASSTIRKARIGLVLGCHIEALPI